MCFAAALFAQDEEALPPKWSGDTALGLSLSRGNSDNTSISFTVNANGRLSERIEWVNSF